METPGSPFFSLALCFRFIIAALTVAAKELCDSFCTNVHYARVGGISLRELNTLELEFLFLIDWRLAINADELQQYYVNLVRQSQVFYIVAGGEESKGSGMDEVVAVPNGTAPAPAAPDLNTRNSAGTWEQTGQQKNAPPEGANDSMEMDTG